jgi:two-component system, LytTR family, sensor histidine kinase AlgZ
MPPSAALPSTDAKAPLRPEPPGAVAIATLRALAAPRRLVPILVVVTPMLVEQSRYHDPRIFVVGVSLAASCVVLAPVSWRILAADKATPARVIAYAALGALVVLSVGIGLPLSLVLRSSFLTAPSSVLISLGLYWVGGWGLGRDIDLEAKLVAQRARSEALAREAERAQLLAARAHLDPHFLFNTLNAIAEWCRVDGVVAEQAVLRLAEMLRAVLAGARAELWPLSREMELVDALFELHRMRDPDRFAVLRVVDNAALSVPVPPLLLLPLAENAVKHGPAAGHRGEIRIAIQRTREGLSIALSNPGAYKGPRPGSEGLPTVERRLALAYGGRAKLAIDRAGDRTEVKLTLPENAS